MVFKFNEICYLTHSISYSPPAAPEYQFKTIHLPHTYFICCCLLLLALQGESHHTSSTHSLKPQTVLEEASLSISPVDYCKHVTGIVYLGVKLLAHRFVNINLTK